MFSGSAPRRRKARGTDMCETYQELIAMGFGRWTVLVAVYGIGASSEQAERSLDSGRALNGTLLWWDEVPPQLRNSTSLSPAVPCQHLRAMPLQSVSAAQRNRCA
jgi:hypothetical protein